MGGRIGNGTIGGNYFSQLYLGGNKNVGLYAIGVSDGIGMVDSTVKSTTKVLGDTTGIADTIAKVLPFITLVDTLLMTDTITKKATKVLIDTAMQLEDFIVRRLNGMIINWEKIKRAVTSWTSGSKKSDDWNKFKGINDRE